MAEFVYFRNACSMHYPVGQYFSSDNFDYIREAASSINKVFPTGKLILVVIGRQTKGLLLILSLYCVIDQIRNESISNTTPILLSMGIYQV